MSVEFHSTKLNQQQKRNATAGALENNVPISQRQHLGSLEDHKNFHHDTQGIPLQMLNPSRGPSNGQDTLNLPILPIQPAVRSTNNARHPSDTHNKSKEVSLNNKVCLLTQSRLKNAKWVVWIFFYHKITSFSQYLFSSIVNFLQFSFYNKC